MGRECAKKAKIKVKTQRRSTVRQNVVHRGSLSYPYDDAYGRRAGCGHHFGTVRDEIEEHWNNRFGSMVKLIP